MRDVSCNHETVETSRFRTRIEAAIDSLMALLDELDGDCDLEQDAGDEPEGPGTDLELTSLERRGNGFAYSGRDDCEMHGD